MLPEQRDTQGVINIIIAGNGLTLKQPALLPPKLSLQTGEEKRGVGWGDGHKRQDDMKEGRQETGGMRVSANVMLLRKKQVKTEGMEEEERLGCGGG